MPSSKVSKFNLKNFMKTGGEMRKPLPSSKVSKFNLKKFMKTGGEMRKPLKKITKKKKKKACWTQCRGGRAKNLGYLSRGGK